MSTRPSLMQDTFRMEPFDCPNCHEGIVVDAEAGDGEVRAWRALPFPLPHQPYSSIPGHVLARIPQSVLEAARIVARSADGCDLEPDLLADAMVTTAAPFLARLADAVLALATTADLMAPGTDLELIDYLRSGETGLTVGPNVPAKQDYWKQQAAKIAVSDDKWSPLT